MIPVFYIILWLIFIIVEMSAPIFYWLAIAIAAFVMSLLSYLWVHDLVIQALIFAILSGGLSYILPKYLKSHYNQPYWMDIYIGQNGKIKILEDWTYKVILDGVEYNFILENSDNETKLKKNELVYISHFNGSEFVWHKMEV